VKLIYEYLVTNAITKADPLIQIFSFFSNYIYIVKAIWILDTNI